MEWLKKNMHRKTAPWRLKGDIPRGCGPQRHLGRSIGRRWLMLPRYRQYSGDKEQLSPYKRHHRELVHHVRIRQIKPQGSYRWTPRGYPLQETNLKGPWGGGLLGQLINGFVHWVTIVVQLKSTEWPEFPRVRTESNRPYQRKAKGRLKAYR